MLYNLLSYPGDHLMNQKPTYEELVKKIHDLEARLSRKAKKADAESSMTEEPQDINGYRDIEEDLQASKEMLQLVMDNIPQHIFWKDRDSIYLGCNRNFAIAAGVETPEAIKGKSDYDLAWKKEETDFFLEYDRRVMETNTPEYHIIEPQLQAGGKQAWLDTNKVPLHDPDGKVVGILDTYEDITERIQTEENLYHYEKIVATTSDFMSIIDSDYVYLAVNDAYVKAHCKERDAIVGHTAADLMGPEVFEHTVKPYLDRAFKGEIVTYDAWFEYPGFGRRYMHVSYYPDLDGDEASGSVVVNAHDITIIRELETKLIQAQKLEAIGTLAGGLAHDFNNLLMGIQGRASLMMSEMDASDPLIEHVKGIEEYVLSATALTDQLLGFARGGKYEVQATDLNELAKNTLEMFGRTKKEIQVSTQYENQLWAVEVDRRQIEQVLLNIFVNAWQAMPDGGDLYLNTENLHIDKSMEVPYTIEPGRFVKISITDTGVGIDESARQRIFDPFFTTKEKKRGTGLGLASAYGIVKNHGGFINVYSEPGRGTTFNIYLPATKSSPEQLSKTEGQIVSGTGVVLIVDDEELVTDIGGQLLARLGYQVMAASGGAEAVEIFRANREAIQLVILDMVMPGMSGSETFDRLKAIDGSVRILLSSGYSINGEATAILNKGCNGFVQKPFNLKQLSRKIREILDTDSGT